MAIAKILSTQAVAKECEILAEQGKKLVFTNGCFDILHVGHVRYLAQARALGDALVVALNDDASVRELKGEKRPINPAEDRAEVLAALACVDYVTVFSGTRVTKTIQKIRPPIYAKGGDYTLETLHPEERTALEKCGAQIELLGLVPGRSTSHILATLKNAQESAQ